MVEVEVKVRDLDENDEEVVGYEKIEPPRMTLDPEEGKSEADYPRFSQAPGYDYEEPRESVMVTSPQKAIFQPVEERPPLNVTSIPIITDLVPQSQQKQIVSIDNSIPQSFKERIKAKKIPEDLTLNSFILLLLGSQNIFLLASAIFESLIYDLKLFTELRTLVETNWWSFFLSAVGVYAAIYLALTFFNARIRISASCFFLIMLSLTAEGVMIICLVPYLTLKYIVMSFIEVIIGIYLTAGLAQCMMDNYKAVLGRIVALIGVIMCTAIYLAFEAFYLTFTYANFDIGMMTACTIVVGTYMWFIVNEVDTYVDEMAGKDTILAGIFCSLMVIKSKIDFCMKIIIFPYYIYLIANTPKARPNEITRPLLVKDSAQPFAPSPSAPSAPIIELK
ncbi:hypothetical protein SteCoe_16822 [Stentor coeruleus]|uniref:Uncharacterized protein n=1 Tax=Stentor coeruleus TaxID=5963 RepID=A0A1R2C0D9_9CILI|nr:hypothetical protein SteCoe_16822 [Stentor coeruleus]